MTRLRLYALVLCAFFGSACSAITDFDRFGPADDGGTEMDGQVLVDGCTPMGVEICNDIDDDCDGEVDENTEDDPENCGACGFACQPVDDAAADCAVGECVANCNTGFGDCDGVYANGCEVDLGDPDNCAACGEVCPTGEVCTSSGCAADCPGSEEVCGRTCIDTTSSTDHCGGCGMPCTDRPSSVTVCAAGSCDFICTADTDDCDGMEDNGCETDLTTLTDCGTCGTVCNYTSGMPACTAGACELASCNTGFDDCDVDVSNGCETDLSTTTDCGTCGNVCADPMSATGSCGAGGTCEFTCDTGFEDCDLDVGTGCEADLNSDTTCGDCTTVCSGATPLCDLGTCVSGCTAPTPTSCSGSCVDTRTDILHCGGCGAVCPTRDHSTPTCTPVGATGTCGFACDAGWADCDGLESNGCEVNILTVTDCGSCGTACTIANGTGTCATGTCAVGSCDTGFDDCSGGAADGCETDITAPSDCGSCGSVCSLLNAVAGCSGGVCTVASCTGGYFDCDTLASTGCEELPGTYYFDADGDLYGAGLAMAFCAVGVPTDWVTMSGDCVDTSAMINPGATELCNGFDDNCNSLIDEGFTVGTACSCEPGAASGTMMCDTGGASSSCSYPSEICNGFDDDCNGMPDGGFPCTAGGTRTCSGALGTCTYVSIQTCSAMCVWGSCDVPAESCNRLDDNCDLFTDEDVLTEGTRVTTVSGVVAFEPRAAWHPIRDEMGVVYGDGSGRVWFVRATLTGTVIGAPVLIDSASRHWDVAFDGTHYSVVHSSGSAGIYVANLSRIDAGTGALGARIIVDPSASGDGANRIAVARVGTRDQVVVIWCEPGSSSQSCEAQIVETQPAVTTASNIGPLERLDSSGGPRQMGWPAATVTASGAMIGYVHWRDDGTSSQIRLHEVFPGTILPIRNTLATAGAIIESWLSITSNRSGTIGLSYVTNAPSPFLPIDTVVNAWSAAGELGEQSLGLHTSTSIAYGADDTFAVLLDSPSVILRVRPTDLRFLPETFLTPTDSFFLMEVGGTHDTRYMVFGSGGAGLRSQPIACP